MRTDGTASDFEVAAAIARRLAAGGIRGGALQTSTEQAMRAIVDTGSGYCADFAQVFNALAYAAGLDVRQWGFTFDDYGASGHTLNEIYDRSLSKWVMIDSFNSFYAEDARSGTPLSMLEFLEKLDTRNPVDEVRIRYFSSRRQFPTDAALLQYFVRGEGQYFLFWGNNSIELDASPVVRLASRFSRAANQAAAIALGIRPRMYLLPTSDNAKEMEELLALRVRVLSAIASAMCLALSTTILGWVTIRDLRRRPDRGVAA